MALGGGQEFVIRRILDASRERVWRAWTDPAQLKHWWGPKGFKVHACKMDLRPGGVFHYGMRGPDGRDMWGKFIYREIVAKEQLEFIVSFSDQKAGLTRHPWSPSWPLHVHSSVNFEDEAGKTKITVRWRPHAATETERRTFEEGRASMQEGWTGTFEQLAEYLARS